MTGLTPEPVRAAGGIVVRYHDDALELVVLHRPHYDDWSLPKGKLDAAETHKDAARREVEEETGLRCTILGPGGRTNYVDHKGRDKAVRYYLMQPLDASLPFAPFDDDEIDAARWVTFEAADELLSYGHDRDLLRRLHTDRRRRELLPTAKSRR